MSQYTPMGLLNGNIRGCHIAICNVLERKKPGYKKYLKGEIERGYELLKEFKEAKVEPNNYVARVWLERCKQDIKILEDTLSRVAPLVK